MAGSTFAVCPHCLKGFSSHAVYMRHVKSHKRKGKK